MVMTRQALTQRPRLKSHGGCGNGLDRHVLDHQVRGHRDHRCHRAAAGMQKGNAGAVRVAQQHGLSHALAGQQCRQHLPGFAVQVVRLQPTGAAHIGHRVRLTVTSPRIHHPGPASGPAYRFRPAGAALGPETDRAQAFMQKNQRCFVGRSGNLLQLKPCTVDIYKFHHAIVKDVSGLQPWRVDHGHKPARYTYGLF